MAQDTGQDELIADLLQEPRNLSADYPFTDDNRLKLDSIWPPHIKHALEESPHKMNEFGRIFVKQYLGNGPDAAIRLHYFLQSIVRPAAEEQTNQPWVISGFPAQVSDQDPILFTPQASQFTNLGSANFYDDGVAGSTFSMGSSTLFKDFVHVDGEFKFNSFVM